MENLTEALTWVLGRPVLDRTGLEGSFDYDLEWPPDDTQVRSLEAPAEFESKDPSLASALRERLGLRLVSGKGAVDWLGVERAERPRAN